MMGLDEVRETQKGLLPLFSPGDAENYIHQINFYEAGPGRGSGWSRSRPKLLMIHGEGGCGCAFYKLVKPLRKYFRITTIDLLGQGASGRPAFDLSSPHQCIDYFVLSIEAWMKASNYRVDDEYILLGHGLGGYVAAQYALKFPTKLTKLVLLSPVGLPSKPADWTTAEMLRSKSAPRRLLTRKGILLWNQGWSPFTLMRGAGYYGAKQLASKYLTEIQVPAGPKSFEADPKEREALVEMLVQVNSRPQSSEASLTILFEAGAWAKLPIQEKLPELQVPICFMYGDSDWASQAAAAEIHKKLHPGSVVVKVPGSGHALMYNNPLDTARNLVAFAYGAQSEQLKGFNLAAGLPHGVASAQAKSRRLSTKGDSETVAAEQEPGRRLSLPATSLQNQAQDPGLLVIVA